MGIKQRAVRTRGWFTRLAMIYKSIKSKAPHPAHLRSFGAISAQPSKNRIDHLEAPFTGSLFFYFV